MAQQLEAMEGVAMIRTVPEFFSSSHLMVATAVIHLNPDTFR
jgi:hypothetical protein